MNKLFLFILFFLLAQFSYSQSKNDADKILGTWQIGSGKGRILITKYGNNKFGGKICWLKEPLDANGKIKLDVNNPDEAKRKNPKIGLNNLLGFVYQGNGKYEDGTIYDSENGKTYSCILELINDSQLKVRGYIGISLIGRTDVWSRVK